jgi:hypothetical protein
VDDDQVIDNAFTKANALLADAGDDLRRLPAEVATFLRVIAAQGVIDNGGYCYFFGNDWPGNPPYGDFIQSYRDIGCTSQAEDLARVVGTFPFAEPHLSRERRLLYIEQNYNEDLFSVTGWGDSLCGDASVWARLAQYVRDHRDIFF